MNGWIETVVVIAAAIWLVRGNTLRSRCFAKLALLHGKVEDVMKAGLDTQPAKHTQYAAVICAEKLAALFFYNRKYKQATAAADSAMSAADKLLSE